MEESGFHKQILIAFLAVGGIAAFIASRDKLRDGFRLFICTLGLGYRSLQITNGLKIIPAELILWALLALLIGQSNRRRNASSTLPIWMWIWLPFWGLAWLNCTGGINPWDICFAEFRNFLLLIPLFLVAPAVFTSTSDWKGFVRFFYFVGVAIAFLGVVENYFPGLTRAIPGFSGNPEAIVTDDGFKRAGFSFYGSPIAVFICVLALPFSAALWKWYPSSSARTAVVVGGVLQLLGVYIAGWRSMWLLVALQAAVFIMMRKKFALGIALLVLGSIGTSMMSDLPRGRIQSLISILEGKPNEADTSGQKRWKRVQDALQSVLDEPIGRGWASAGWVHSDFLQIAANQGIIPGILVLGLYLATFIRLYRQVRREGAGEELPLLTLSLLLAFIAVGGMLLFEGVEVTPQTVLPVWFIWAMAEIRLKKRLSMTSATRPTSSLPQSVRVRAWNWKPIAQTS